MRAVKSQFFLAFAVMGSIMPFLAVYLKEDQGLTESQIGYIIAASSVAVFITPVIITLLADTRLDPRRLVAVSFLLCGVFLGLMGFFLGFWATLLLFGLYSMAFVAIVPLQDGINFSIQRKREDAGLPTHPYHRIRVWGTIGFIVPSLLIYWFIERGAATSIILFTGVFFSLAGILNCWLIPDPRLGARYGDGAKEAGAWGLPTVGAAKTLFRGNALIFCLGMAVAQIASSAYFAFYPLYLTEEVGLDRKWVGLIFNVGVAVEILFILGLGYLIRTLGLRRLILLGIFCMAVRSALLAFFPTVGMAVAGQVLHGLIVIALYVAPVMYINRQAADRYRNSIQGLYTMTVVGGARIAGSVFAGHLAENSLILLFLISTGLGLGTLVLFLVAFRAEPSDRSPF